MLHKIKEQHGGHLDVLVSNAACLAHSGTTLTIDEKSFDKLFDINVKASFFLIKECLPLLQASKSANILVVSSVTGTTPQEIIGVYSMTKAALDNMVKGLAQELRNDHIRVNGIAPGLIKTKFSAPMWK